MLLVLLLALLLLVHNTQACADPLKVDALIIGAGQGADIGSSYWALNRCPSCREHGLGITGKAATGLAFSAGTVVLCRELRKTGHGKSARWLAISMAVLGGAFAAHNLATGWHAKQR
jgi:hypothetical protein